MPKLRDMLASGGLQLEQSDISHRDSNSRQEPRDVRAGNETSPLDAPETTSARLVVPERKASGQIDHYV